ncbi:hypothetical protein GCM10010129_47780 [Streptomyces fumigatiscleroticus]|nr:hypothetical protein GCM10010129_47780 [Streptomyces fumigatiscleroticus]
MSTFQDREVPGMTDRPLARPDPDDLRPGRCRPRRGTAAGAAAPDPPDGASAQVGRAFGGPPGGRARPGGGAGHRIRLRPKGREAVMAEIGDFLSFSGLRAAWGRLPDGAGG